MLWSSESSIVRNITKKLHYDGFTFYRTIIIVPSDVVNIQTITDKLQLTGQNLGRVFNFRNGRVHVVHFLCYVVKLPNLKLKTQPKQLLGYLPLDIVLPEPIKRKH
jgi:hypothetical protein